MIVAFFPQAALGGLIALTLALLLLLPLLLDVDDAAPSRG